MKSEENAGFVEKIELGKYVERSYEEQVEAGKNYVRYGEDNLFPQYLIDLYNSSVVHHALVNSIGQMIFGNGLRGDVIGEAWAQETGLADEIRKACIDLKLQGGFYLEVLWNLEHKTVKKVRHTPFEQWRTGKTDKNGRIKRFYHCLNWEDTVKNKVRDYEAFDENGQDQVQILYVRPFSVGSMHYPKPDYIGAVNWIEVDKQVSIYHNSNLRNGMSPGFAIHWKNGTPPKHKREEIRRDIERQLTGVRNSGNFWMTFSDGGDTTPDITPFELSQASEQYQFVSEESTNKIMIGHRVTTPAMFGVKTAGQLSGSSELDAARKIFHENVIQQNQQIVNEALRQVMKYAPSSGTLEVYSEIETEASKDSSFDSGQIDSVVEVIAKVKAEELTKAQAVQILVTMLNYDEAAAEALFDDQLKLNKELTDDQFKEVLAYLDEVGEVVNEEEWELLNEEEVEQPEQEYVLHLGGESHKFFKRFANPDDKSEIDSGLYKIRYRYSQNLNSNSRLFCRNMVANSKRGVSYRFEDIQKMGRDGINGEFAPSGQNSYSIWLHKGGAYCHHRWVRQVWFRKRDRGRFLPNKGLDNDKRVSVRSAQAAGVPFKDKSRGWQTASDRPIDRPNRGKLN